VTSHGEACVARGMASHAPAGAGKGPSSLFRDCLSRSRLVCALALSTDRAVRVASAVANQYGRHVSASQECSLSALARVGAAARHAVGKRGHGVSGPEATAQLHVAGTVG